MANWSLNAGEGQGSLLDWGPPVLVVDPEGPRSAGRRGALGVANSKVDTKPGRGMWRRAHRVLFPPVECPGRPDWRKAKVRWRVEVAGGGQQRRFPLLLARQEHYEEGVQVGSPVSISC